MSKEENRLKAGRSRSFAVWTLALFLLASGAASCRRHDYRLAYINVPGMKDAATAAMVYNAIAHEIERKEPRYHVDTNKGILTCFGHVKQLRPPMVHRRIEDSLNDLRMPGKILRAKPAPAQGFHERFAVAVQVTDMDSVVKANRAIAAVSTAVRSPQASENLRKHIAIDIDDRSVRVKYNSIELSLKNLEHAVANAGLQANEVPPRLGRETALKHGW
ncbi:MAG: hypothetical protein R6V03_10160 [Kiritimatiellia bacterium]